jgi:methyltransferase
MELTARLYLALVLLTAALRLLELARSRRNQRKLAAAGSVKSADAGYKWMVGLHCAVLAGCVMEVWAFARPWNPVLGWPMLALFVGANATRWWVIRTLGPRWNVEVMSASRLGVVTAEGPYRWVRHPNYTAVFVEMLALPLIHSAWVTATIGSVLHLFVLLHRVELEERVLGEDPVWREAFAKRPRFVPRLI